MDRMMRLLADLSPDLLCLQEVAPDLMRVLVTQLDYPHVLHHRDQHGFTALLSRLPFTTLWWPSRTGDQVRYVTAGVELGGGERVAVTGIHLSPKWESRRLMELQRLESELAELRYQPQLWLGDFNSLTRADYSETAWQRVGRERKHWESPRTTLTDRLTALDLTGNGRT